MVVYSSFFENAFALLMEQEGIFCKIEGDAGGPTKFGLSKRFLGTYYKRDMPENEIICLTRENAKKIYFEEFWEKNNYEKFPKKLGFLCFSCAVNMGAYTANLLLQKACLVLLPACGLDSDGIIGAKTMATINSCKENPLSYIYLCLLTDRYRRIATEPHNRQFLLGWLNRIYSCLTFK